MVFQEYITDEVNYYLDRCNFTDEESMIFINLAKGNTTFDVSDMLCLSVSTVNKKIKHIKHKIQKVDAHNENKNKGCLM